MGWKLRCVQNGEVYIIDHGCFSRPGPRIVEGVEMMAALFRNILPPKVAKSTFYSKWAKVALKYQCQTKNEDTVGLSVSHCTTELSSRFVPCFGGSDCDLDDTSNCTLLSPVENKKNSALNLCRVNRCTIPNSELPLNRSAHCIVPIYRRGHKRLSILLFGGESQDAKRLDDAWELHAP